MKIVGLENLIKYFNESKVIGITNWSQIINSNDIWEGILRDIMPRLDRNIKRYIYFDLADPSNRSKEDFVLALKIIEAYGSYGENVLGLNKKEAGIIYKMLYDDESDKSINEIGEKIANKLNIKKL